MRNSTTASQVTLLDVAVVRSRGPVEQEQVTAITHAISARGDRAHVVAIDQILDALTERIRADALVGTPNSCAVVRRMAALTGLPCVIVEHAVEIDATTQLAMLLRQPDVHSPVLSVVARPDTTPQVALARVDLEPIGGSMHLEIGHDIMQFADGRLRVELRTDRGRSRVRIVVVDAARQALLDRSIPLDATITATAAEGGIVMLDRTAHRLAAGMVVSIGPNDRVVRESSLGRASNP